MFFIQSHRTSTGILLLLLVDLIWVSSSELTQYIYHNKDFNKPFFTTYFKTCLFAVYFVGFAFYEPWRRQIYQWINSLWSDKRRRTVYSRLAQADQSEDVDEVGGGDGGDALAYRTIGDPVWVPTKYSENESCIRECSEDEAMAVKRCNMKSVRFSSLTEVRQLSEADGHEALLARLSHDASELHALRSAKQLTTSETAKLAARFCLIWFLANFSYQTALLYSEAGLISVLSCSSSLFVLILASQIPGRLPADEFSFTKCVAIIVAILGVGLISSSELQIASENLPLGTSWALVGALFYAGYTLTMKYKVEDEGNIDMPLFFGFVGLFNGLFLWPGLLILHYCKIELFRWPDSEQWFLILVNGLIGTVLSELLWLWGCFLTSSLIATLSLSLTVPLTVLFDMVLKSVKYPTLFYLGSIPVVASFVFLSILCHYENVIMSKWDPLGGFLCNAIRSRSQNSAKNSHLHLPTDEEV